ncbi:ATP F0F1 synthase subunit B [Cypionkella sp.]|jgi:F-type H+-transporting ATPase subunit b|uniref:F0F1 ATP synthase subunit B family protein n=1 Tax=Cypionkella sp. TaxID=2811411 RepID=UPI002728B274|nr:ATP F0F1 synthase subunit B [Cypionkella sp.]MDO8983372.1 ATP F0F1 synthase subunit B [Cypionkella sp.]MDP1575633.1 ATP F0F1 synthase subunit B [Cypionkella sp.]MDP2050216.1 ATP F0F1 synthase subunit B [Cypionkella sp.]
MKKVFYIIALLGIVAVLTGNNHGEPLVSLRNTNFVVLIAFLIFVGILLYTGVPAKLATALDARATRIKTELDEARALRDEAKALLGSYDAKHKEVLEQSARIIASAKEEAQAAAAQAKADLKDSIARRLAAADEQIASAEASALRQIRESAISVAVAAAGEVLAKQATAQTAAASIDAAIATVDAKFH